MTKTKNKQSYEPKLSKKMQKEKRKANYGLVKNNFYFMKLMFKLSPARIIMAAIHSAINYLFWMWGGIVVTKYVFTALENSTPFLEIMPFLILTITLYFLDELYSNWYYHRYLPISNEKINAKFMRILYNKTNSVELACFEDADFFNKYTLALAEVNERFEKILNSVVSIIIAMFAIGYVYVTLWNIDKFLILFALCPAIGTLFFNKISSKLGVKRARVLNPYKRKKDYVSRILYLNSYAKEIKLSNAHNILEKEYLEATNGINKTMKSYAPKFIPLHIGSSLFNFTLMFEGIMFYAAFRAIVSRTLTVTDFGIVAGAMAAATHTLIGFFNGINSAIENGYFIDNLRIFLDYAPKIPENANGIVPDNKIESIEFKNVSFTYPQGKEPVFTNLTLKADIKEKIVIVGLNGAGKSTFVKLLMRFYDPDAGEILVNGINIKDYKLNEYRSLFRAAFQDYQLFSMSVFENVIMKSEENEKDKTAAFAALTASGIIDRIQTLPRGADSTVTKEFDPDGAVFSGGEGQKVAISRAMFEGSSICVFDEPSSALDAVAESRLYDELLKTAEDKIVFFISHRLSAAAYADKVALIDGQAVKEFGTHNELLKQKGMYYDMFNMQAEKYREEIDWSKEESINV